MRPVSYAGLRISETRETTEDRVELIVRIQFPPADSPSLSGFRVRSRAKPGFSAIMRTMPGGSCRQRRAKPSSVGPSSVGVSVGPYSSTAVLPDAFRDIGGAGRKQSRLAPGQ